MTIHLVILLLCLLQLKHLIVDWCWQPEFEWKNKGTYGHAGGYRHAFKNAVGTAICFGFFLPFSLNLILIFLLDGIIHYHIDWCKMNINKIKNWGPLTHPQFWWLTGLDQCLHQFTYLLLVVLFIS